MTTPATDLRQPATATTTPQRPRLVRAELMKIFTTNSWWIFGLFMLAATALALLINLFQAVGDLSFAESGGNAPPDFSDVPADQRPDPAQMAAIEADYARATDLPRVLVTSAANVYTSGQLLNLMFIVVLGALIVTNEYFHQTATATFLTTPHRTRVIVGKLAAALIMAAGFWAATTVINVAVGAITFASNGHGVPFDHWTIIRAVLMNLLAYVIWAILGVGLGVLIRSQLGATITGAAMYWISWPVAGVLFGIIRAYVIKNDWVWNLTVIFPGVASYLMVAAERVQFGFNAYSPPWWVGALVLLGYGVLAGVFGTLITRRRDVS
jgi:ABC-type transport system involved in multi-copper enzyme maturation permease subunit